MWRVHGFVGRVLHRYHGSNTLRLPQNHHVEDEVINGSAVLSTSRHSSENSSQKEGDGERKRKQRTFQFGYAELPRYTALDAVGWGAVAVLFMQICRKLHSSFSSSTDPGPNPGALTPHSTLQKCGYRILQEIISKRDVLPQGQSVLCLKGVSEGQTQSLDQCSAQSSSSSSSSSDGPSRSKEQLTDGSSISDHQRELLIQNSHRLACPLQSDASQENTERRDEEALLTDEERLAEAALNLRRVGETSVPIILNIIGLESAKSEKYKEAFCCFHAAAQQGYSKAQFNTGVCYEKGRGVGKDKEKALYYYQQAAVSGHRQAQYRFAKLVLTSRGQQTEEEMNTAISLLEEAAAAGLTKAQMCLASVYFQDPVKYGCKFVQYLKMAAESGDGTALLFLAQCSESGLGVQQNLNTASELYRRAAQAGNKLAQSLLAPLNKIHRKEEATMRSIRSDPCFSSVNSRRQSPLSSLTGSALPLLPHSWSTGSLAAPLSLSAAPLHLHPPATERAACQWTLGIG
ncbi:death ligand signal enhancer isoform X2 [Cololabis saira]|uniref:death ligand signal enhancer isoform X2 n=1 Tax=Cololabis saira TaxID=129043 RepID=UPI002AD49793|nr:death ligand signal enhancer isoform X2 [Cololabis saira]